MEPVNECVRDVEAQEALKNSDYTAALQSVEELKQKVALGRPTSLGLTLSGHG